ncbi:stage III sporulation protein AG [Brevibacillus ginsengisoli]|uniref:stage III sporulation protein AG n=1 Tax=Brevibacillus ginsengisoli TaxID=363854 RepID=UPI003CEF0B0E
MMEWLRKIFETNSKAKKMRPIHYFIVLLGIGVAFMIFTDFLAVKPERSMNDRMGQTTMPSGDQESNPVFGSSVEKNVIREYENMYETQLEEILENIIGVGKVEVMVNLDSTPEIIVEKDRDTRSATTNEVDKDKATRNQSDQSRNEKVVVLNAKQEQPVVVKTVKPKVRGVLVVAKGAENIQVKAWITEAVQKVLEVPAYKISILPKKG